MDETGFAIVGCGMIAGFHAKAIADVPGAKLRAVFDTNPANAERIAQQAGGDVAVFTDLGKMLKRSDVHVVNICTPSGAHLEPGVKAAKAGKHVIVEKPLEITLKRCDKLIEACDKAGVALGTILPSRYSEANAALKKAIEQGRFGRLTLGDTTVKWWRTQEYYNSGGWRGTWALDGGGALMNQAIHNVDLLQYMMGPVTQICAFTDLLAHERIEVEDTAVAILRFANGALGVIEAATSAYPGLLKTIGVHGAKGSAVVEQDSFLTWSFADETPDDASLRERLGRNNESTGGASDPSAISHVGHAKQLTDFVEAVRSGRKPAVDGREGRKSVEIIMAVYQSQVSGKMVTLPLARDPKVPNFGTKSPASSAKDLAASPASEQSLKAVDDESVGLVPRSGISIAEDVSEEGQPQQHRDDQSSRENNPQNPGQPPLSPPAHPRDLAPEPIETMPGQMMGDPGQS